MPEQLHKLAAVPFNNQTRVGGSYMKVGPSLPKLIFLVLPKSCYDRLAAF